METTPSITAIFDGLPYPHLKRGTQIVVVVVVWSKLPKGCSYDYLDGFDYFLFGFEAEGKILEGVVTNPFGKTRVKL